MERIATADTQASATPSGGPLADESGSVTPLDSGLLDAMPRQREVLDGAGELRFGTATPAAVSVAASTPAVPGEPYVLTALRRVRPWRLLPTPTGTPFTFCYGVLLVVTSLVAQYADPTFVNELHQASSTDVTHLLRDPFLVLVASALWIVGGMVSPYAFLFLLVLTALERRIGGVRAAGVFLFGHIVATLATEGTVGIAVLVGHLPDSSLHRLDYGISFGVATSIGALSGLLRPWLGLPLITLFGWSLVTDLIAFTDPMTNWGHLISLTIGVATWPLIRRWARTAQVNRAATVAGAARVEAAGA
ncbi:rhomboid-like protein [Streptomyces sp. N50]|uniref:rhomboid-like protein n=1 Tax=Streptomyces sp. N50 TaxID=3081765 RepID=UPI002962510A|nr:rhomboid-like protein [Streptomyces sp. N50]WOX12513.1 rhomboid-like protein [Streptomyces sp. N50]